MISNTEKQTGVLFGDLWSKLTDEQYRHSVELFTKRAIANEFDLDWLKDKNCLDAGCGSARYSVALALHGAKSVVAVDVSSAGLREAQRRASSHERILFYQASVLDLPFRNASFDFVFSSGVIHHTVDFDRALNELARVCAPGGKLFLLVYGFGGLRWKVIKALRAIAADLGQQFLERAIDAAGLPANNKKHFIDDLFVPIQKLTRFCELSPQLKSLGFSEIHRWTGETFDHENSPKAQLEDMSKLCGISAAALDLAKNAVQRELVTLFGQVATLYAETARRVVLDDSLSPEEVRDIVIGEGNLRILATKN